MYLKNQAFLVLGLSRSGKAAAEFLLKSGASVYLYDDVRSERLMQTLQELLEKGAKQLKSEELSSACESCDALVLNMGMLSPTRLEAMIRCGKAANQKGIPVILDPVGAGCSTFRKNAVKTLLSEVKCSVIRGNLSEMLVLCDMQTAFCGVDTNRHAITADEILPHLQSLAQKYNTVIAMSGKVDLITDGKRTLLDE